MKAYVVSILLSFGIGYLYFWSSEIALVLAFVMLSAPFVCLCQVKPNFPMKPFLGFFACVILTAGLALKLGVFGLLDATSIAIWIPSSILILLISAGAHRTGLTPHRLRFFQFILYAVALAVAYSWGAYRYEHFFQNRPNDNGLTIAFLSVFFGLQLLLYYPYRHRKILFAGPFFHLFILWAVLLASIPSVSVLMTPGGVNDFTFSQCLIVKELARRGTAFATVLLTVASIIVARTKVRQPAQ